jgi:hypothetical protein
MRPLPIAGWLIALLLGLTGCRKDDVQIAALNTNPFDADYAGADVFVPEGTELVVESIPGVGTISRQVIRFRVRNELFLSAQQGRPYSVRVVDEAAGVSLFLDQPGPGEHRFTYSRSEPSPGVPVCIELRLANNFSVARPETICVTL